MKTALLRRTEMGDAGTFGTLEIDGQTYVTGELPWRDNRRGHSCVPAATYRVSWQPSPKYGHKYHLLNVPDRSDIIIHSANLVGDQDKGFKHEVDGCIALGLARGVVDGQPAVTGSRSAVDAFEKLMGLADFELTILDEWREAGEVPGTAA